MSKPSAESNEATETKETTEAQPSPKETKEAEAASAEADATEDKEDATAAKAAAKEDAPAAPSTPPGVPQPKAAAELAEMSFEKRIAYIQKTMTFTHQWILLADTKGGLLLTASGVIAGFMLTQFGKFSKIWPLASTWYIGLVLGLFALYAIYQTISFLHTMWTILPRPMSMPKDVLGHTRHIFNYSLTLHFPTLKERGKLLEEYAELTEEELFEEYVTQLHVDSIVCTNKYTSFMKAFSALKIALVFAALSFLGTIPALQLAGAKKGKKKQMAQQLTPKQQKKQAKRQAPPARKSHAKAASRAKKAAKPASR